MYAYNHTPSARRSRTLREARAGNEREDWSIRLNNTYADKTSQVAKGPELSADHIQRKYNDKILVYKS